MYFVKEIQNSSRERISLEEARMRAGPIWQEMSGRERAGYYDRANQETRRFERETNPGEKLNSYGVQIAQIEKENEDREAKKRNMKRDIESTVRSSVQRGEFEKQKYYFIMANYFVLTDPGDIYVPAELSIAEFSLADGVRKKYHTFVNPGVDFYGHMHQAKEHSKLTHQLPLPPNAMGEKNLTRIFNDILAFIGNDKDDGNTPVYTHRSAIPIVESVLQFLAVDHPDPNVDEKTHVYSIQHLLFIMKEAACEIGELTKIQSSHITDAYFENDVYEYQAGLSCNYHEELDKSKFCTQSLVTRWGFMFCKYMCSDVAISMVPGRHTPKEVQVAYAVIPGGGSPKHKFKREHKDSDSDSDGPEHSKKLYKRRAH